MDMTIGMKYNVIFKLCGEISSMRQFEVRVERCSTNIDKIVYMVGPSIIFANFFMAVCVRRFTDFDLTYCTPVKEFINRSSNWTYYKDPWKNTYTKILNHSKKLLYERQASNGMLVGHHKLLPNAPGLQKRPEFRIRFACIFIILYP